MSALGQIGENALTQVRGTVMLAAVAWTILRLAARPRYWPRTVRAVFARQILFTGVEALKFVAVLALLTGMVVVVQSQQWLVKLGQSDMMGPILVSIVIRGVGPLLVGFIVVGRSGTAIAVEIANMKVNGEIRVLETQGIDPLVYLALPRVLGMSVSIFCLTMFFILIALAGGYGFAVLVGKAGDPAVFVETVLKAVQPVEDVFNLLARTLIPGGLAAVLCVIEGLNVRTSITEVPQAAARAMVRSIAMLFVVSAVISVLSFL